MSDVWGGQNPYTVEWSYEEGAVADSCKFYLASKICIDNSTKVCYNTRHEKTRFS